MNITSAFKNMNFTDRNVVDLDRVYSKVWHALDTVQQLDLCLITQNKEVKGIDLDHTINQLKDVLRHIKPGGRFPSVYAGVDDETDNDEDSDMILE